MQRALWDPVDPRRLGSLADSLEFRVNGEVFRFADRRTLRRFMQAPVRWCGVVRDPVTGCRFQPTAHSPQAYWIGGPPFFGGHSTPRRLPVQPPPSPLLPREYRPPAAPPPAL